MRCGSHNFKGICAWKHRLEKEFETSPCRPKESDLSRCLHHRHTLLKQKRRVESFLPWLVAGFSCTKSGIRSRYCIFLCIMSLLKHIAYWITLVKKYMYVVSGGSRPITQDYLFALAFWVMHSPSSSSYKRKGHFYPFTSFMPRQNAQLSNL